MSLAATQDATNRHLPQPLRRLFKALSRIPNPVRILSMLALGLALGLLFPHNALVQAIYLSGTYFPRIIVTLAALLVFCLLTAATAKLILYHKENAGKLFARILILYAVMGVVSLIYVVAWLAVLSGLPATLPGVPLPAPSELLKELGGTSQICSLGSLSCRRWQEGSWPGG